MEGVRDKQTKLGRWTDRDRDTKETETNTHTSHHTHAYVDAGRDTGRGGLGERQ